MDFLISHLQSDQGKKRTGWESKNVTFFALEKKPEFIFTKKPSASLASKREERGGKTEKTEKEMEEEEITFYINVPGKKRKKV